MKTLTKTNVLGVILIPFLVKSLLTCGALLWLFSIWRAGNVKDEIFVCLLLLLGVIILLPFTIRDLMRMLSVQKNGIHITTKAVVFKRELTSKGIGFEGHDRTDYYLDFADDEIVPVDKSEFDSAEQGDLCYIIEFLGDGEKPFCKKGYLVKHTELSPELDDLLWKH